MKHLTVDAYLDHLDLNARDKLIEIKDYVTKQVPDIEVVLSYQLMAFKTHHILFYIGAFKHHIGLYPAHYMNFLLPYIQKLKHSKGAIQIPYDMPFPYHLIDLILEKRDVR